MVPSPTVLARATDPLGGNLSDTVDSFSHDTVQIVGTAVALTIAVGGIMWLGIRFFRKRREAKKQRQFDLAHPTVSEDDLKGASEANYRQDNTLEFSRDQLIKNVVLPERAFIPKDATRVQTHELLPADGVGSHPVTLPAIRPARPRSSPSSRRSPSRRPVSGGSFLSIAPMPNRNSTHSTTSTMSVFDESHMRKVRQVFGTTLPDELMIRTGERLAVVQTFDDGWCIVGRDSRTRAGDIELGAVPAWVFIEPVEGVRPERLIRTSSLGVTVTLDAPGGPCFSWSNAS